VRAYAAPVPRALVLHHDSNSLAGLLPDLLDDAGLAVDERYVTPFGEPADPGDFGRVGDDLAGIDAIVVLGSGWSVYDPAVAHWVEPELEFLRAADLAGVPCLGICFGHQLLAAAHGGIVARTPHPEIGWHTVGPAPDAPFDDGPWFQWHLDHATLPPGATLLGATDGGTQGMRLRRNLSVQFHPELDVATLAAWLETDRHWLAERDIDADALLAETERRVPDTVERTRALLAHFLDEVAT